MQLTCTLLVLAVERLAGWRAFGTSSWKRRACHRERCMGTCRERHQTYKIARAD